MLHNVVAEVRGWRLDGKLDRATIGLGSLIARCRL